MASESTGTKGQPYFASGGAPAIDVDPSAVADYAALVGNTVAGTATQRAANVLPGPGVWAGKPVWTGLVWSETDTNLLWLCVVTGGTPSWFQIAGKPVTGTITFSGIYAAGGVAPTLTSQSGRVALDGIVTSTTATFNAGTTYTLGSIPTAFAPAAQQNFACVTNGSALATIAVTAAGGITMATNTTFTGSLLLSLANCTWKAK